MTGCEQARMLLLAYRLHHVTIREAKAKAALNHALATLMRVVDASEDLPPELGRDLQELEQIYLEYEVCTQEGEGSHG